MNKVQKDHVLKMYWRYIQEKAKTKQKQAQETNRNRIKTSILMMDRMVEFDRKLKHCFRNNINIMQIENRKNFNSVPCFTMRVLFHFVVNNK